MFGTGAFQRANVREARPIGVALRSLGIRKMMHDAVQYLALQH